MAYNPFDDIIEQDPAYMATGGPTLDVSGVPQAYKDYFKIGSNYLKSQGIDISQTEFNAGEVEALGRKISEAQPGKSYQFSQQPVQKPPTNVPVPEFISQGQQIKEKQRKLEELQNIVPGAFNQYMQDVYQQRQQEDFSDVQQTIGKGGAFVYDLFLPQELIASAEAKKAKNKQIIEDLGIQFNTNPRGKRVSDEDKQRMAEAGYEELNPLEVLSGAPKFLLEDQYKAFNKLANGEPLTDMDKYNFIVAPLDLADAFALSFFAKKGISKLISSLKKKYFDEAGVPDVKTLLEDARYKNDPEVRMLNDAINGKPLPIQREEGTFDFLDINQEYSPQSSLVDMDLGNQQQVAFATGINKGNRGVVLDYLKNDVEDYFSSLGPDGRASPSGFLKYLKSTGKQLNVTPEYRNELMHATRALDRFKGDRKIFPGTVNSWMIQVADTLNNLDKPMYVDEVAKLVEKELEGIESGLSKKVNAGLIKQWLKGSPEDAGLSPKGLENLIQKDGKFISKTQGQHYEIKDQLKTLLSKLESGEIAPNKGLGSKEYEIVFSDGTTRTLSNIWEELKRGQKRNLVEKIKNKESMFNIVGMEDFEKLQPYVKVVKDGEGIVDETLFKNYIPEPTKAIGSKYQQNLQFLKDLYRPGGLGVFKDFEELADAYGIEKVLKGDPDAVAIRKSNQEKINKLAEDLNLFLTSSKGGEKALNKSQIAAYKKVVDDTIKLSKYNKQKFIETLNKSPKLKQKLIDEYTQYYKDKVKYDPYFKNKSPEFIKDYLDNKLTEDNIINAGMKAFEGHVSHVFRIEDFRKGDQGMEFMGAIGNTVRSNLGIENFALQPKAENVLRAAVKQIKDGLKKGLNPFDNTSLASFNNKQHPRHALAAIEYYAKLLERKGMGAYVRIPKEDLTPEVIKVINDYLGKPITGTIDKLGAPDNIASKFNDIFIGSEKPLTLEQNKARFDELMNFYLKNPDKLIVTPPTAKPKKAPEMIEGILETPYKRAGFINTDLVDIERATSFKRGGPVRMAIGGDPLQNLNQQQFAPDPAFDGEDYFSQAVESGNLYAFNPFKLLNIFGKIDGVATPNKVKPSILPSPNADNITPALVPSVEKSDFPFQSFMMEKMYAPNAPKSAQPEAWKQYLLGGNQPVKQAEIQDSGILQYLDDYAGYFPGKKIDRETIAQYYETSPVGNLSVKIKQGNRPPAEAEEANKLFNHSGKARHQGTGSARIDEGGTDYREVVIQAGAIPNESKAFVNSSHFEEPNTIGFSRVANYNNLDGDQVAVIQELQTDMLTSLQKEQDRLQAMLTRLDNIKDKLQRDLNSPDIEVRNTAERRMNEINTKFPPDTIEFLKQNPNLLKPFPNEAGKAMIPDYSKELLDLQKQIDALVKAKVDTGVNELDDSIYSIAELQKNIRNKLYDLNRSVELDDQVQGFQVPDMSQRDSLGEFSRADDFRLGTSTHDLKLFPNFPFQSQQDYVDLILKATIKDAQTRGINKIAIMPAEVGPIKRWNKDKNGPSGKKFIDLYDKVTPQVMKNIAKKYDGTLQVEKIVDPSKAEKGLKYFNKDVDGSFSLLKEDELNSDLSFGEIDSYVNMKLEKAAHDMGANNVVYTKEIAPGQTMDYYVQPTTREQTSMEGVTGTVSDFELVPLGPGDDINAAQLHIVETNPQLVDMYTLTLDSPKAQEPFFLYGKKDGGKIASDGLVSITDIYGDY